MSREDNKQVIALGIKHGKMDRVASKQGKRHNLPKRCGMISKQRACWQQVEDKKR